MFAHDRFRPRHERLAIIWIGYTAWPTDARIAETVAAHTEAELDALLATRGCWVAPGQATR